MWISKETLESLSREPHYSTPLKLSKKQRAKIKISLLTRWRIWRLNNRYKKEYALGLKSRGGPQDGPYIFEIDKSLPQAPVRVDKPRGKPQGATPSIWKESDRKWRRVAFFSLVFFVLLVLWVVSYPIQEYRLTREVVKPAATPAPPRKMSSLSPLRIRPALPATVVLPLIAKCESGGRHFEADGVTPLRNREGTSAIGTYQIMESIHGQVALLMGYDIRTEEGNEAYATYLYNQSGTQHWEADEHTKKCLERELLALTRPPPADKQLAALESGP